MATVVGIIAALLLGFLGGRVYEIRQQMICDKDLGNHRRSAETRVEIEGPGELDWRDRDLVETLDRDIRKLVTSVVSAQRHPTIEVRGLRPMPYSRT